jgi:outer membrane receptor protein involved in Fe transport
MNKSIFYGGRQRVCALIVASSGLLWSQSSPVGHISGTVVSPTGTPVIGALVQALTPRGTLETRTNDKGQFRFTQLVPNKVTVKVIAKGFSGFRADTLVVVNQTATLNVKLHKEAEAVVVVVDALPADIMDTTEAKTGMVTNFEAIDELPIVGDSLFDRIDYSVIRAPGADNFIIHGADETQNNFQVDGVDATDQNYGGRAIKINNDFIDQVQVLTGGVSAKYGRFSGSVINATTKSGTNEFVGSARFDITDPKWNSVGKLPYYYAAYHMPAPPRPLDQHSTTQSYTFMGPIVKDKVFFAVAYQCISPILSLNSVTMSPDFGGIPYKITQNDTIKDAKLDWQVNGSNRVSAEWNQHETSANNDLMDGTNTSLATLAGRTTSKNGYWALGFTSQLQSNLLLDMKYNDTTVNSGGPGTGPTGGSNVATWQSAIFPYDLLDNGVGASNPVQSHMRNLAANLTWFVEAAGMHQLEAGVQSFRYSRDTAASITPSNYLITFDGYVPGTTTDGLSSRALAVNNAAETNLASYSPIEGRVDTKVESLYLNDTWVVDKNWSANIGVRYDHYKADSNPEHNAYDFGVATPRLSLNYDIKGDKTHVLSLSAAVYSGQITQGMLAGASVSQTPILNSYVYIGTGGPNQGLGSDGLTSTGAINWNAWGNASGATGKGNPNYVSNPLVNRNVFVDPNLKAPRARELNIGYRHDADGQTLTVNLIRRWTDQYVDDFWTGNATTGVASIVYTNDPNGHQNYYGLEATYRRRFNSGLSFGGNFTWARTLENAGETLGGSTSAANNFGNTIPNSQLQPYGPAPSLDCPIMANADLAYQRHLGPGQANVGVVATFKGKHCAGFAQGMANSPMSSVMQGYAPYYTRMFPELGPERDPSYYSFDVQTGYVLEVSRAFKPYIKINVKNVLNQMAPTNKYWYGQVTDAAGNMFPADGSAASDKFVPDPMNGTTAYYQTPRTVQLVVGCRF